MIRIWTVLYFNTVIRPWRGWLNIATLVSMFIHFFHVHLLWKRISEMNGGFLAYLLAQVENCCCCFQKTFQPKLRPYPFKLKCQKIYIYKWSICLYICYNVYFFFFKIMLLDHFIFIAFQF